MQGERLTASHRPFRDTEGRDVPEADWTRQELQQPGMNKRVLPFPYLKPNPSLGCRSLLFE